MRHGEQTGIELDAWLSDDPELGLVYANMHDWAAAHPCNCEALCTCDDEEGAASSAGETGE